MKKPEDGENQLKNRPDPKFFGINTASKKRTRPNNSDQQTKSLNEQNSFDKKRLKTEKKIPDSSSTKRSRIHELPNLIELLEKVASSENEEFYHRALLLKSKQDSNLLNLDQALRSASLLSSSELDARILRKNNPNHKINDKNSNEEDEVFLRRRLEDILKWKMSRGKFRPTLPSLLAKNSNEDINGVILNVMIKLKELKKRKESNPTNICEVLDSDIFNELCKLKGIGPATASAFLSFEVPDLVPFFSDELANYFESSLGKIKYTIKFYKDLVNCCEAEVEKLNNSDKEKQEKLHGRESRNEKLIWNFEKLEKSIWAISIFNGRLSEEEWAEFCNH